MHWKQALRYFKLCPLWPPFAILYIESWYEQYEHNFQEIEMSIAVNCDWWKYIILCKTPSHVSCNFWTLASKNIILDNHDVAIEAYNDTYISEGLFIKQHEIEYIGNKD